MKKIQLISLKGEIEKSIPTYIYQAEKEGYIINKVEITSNNNAFIYVTKKGVE